MCVKNLFLGYRRGYSGRVGEEWGGLGYRVGGLLGMILGGGGGCFGSVGVVFRRLVRLLFMSCLT